MKIKASVLSLLIVTPLAAPLPAFADRGATPVWPVFTVQEITTGKVQKITTGKVQEITTGKVQEIPTDAGCDKTCQDNKIAYAAALTFCRNSALQYQNNAAQYINSDTVFIIVAALGTALGVSSIANAKSWGALGGSSGIAASWKAGTDPITAADEKKLSNINAILIELSGMASDDKNLARQGFALQVEAIGSKCAAPVVATPAKQEPAPVKLGA